MNRSKIFFIFFTLVVFAASIVTSLGSKTTQNIIAEAIDNLSHIDFYESLANPYVRYVRINEGDRKEQIVDKFKSTLHWDDKDVAKFLAYGGSLKSEGHYYPDTYLVPVDASGSDVKKIITDRFSDKYNNIRSKLSTSTINTNTVLTIASIIQREAAGKSDMNLISGIIWNRMFEGMPLQMDATLQYAKGDDTNGWWPAVSAQDKNIDSPYNTYKNKGLPPTPIANPGLAAITAALSPATTDCLYYIHANGIIHCSATYEGHLKNVAKYLK